MKQKTRKFIRKIYNKPTSFIPLHEPFFGGNEKKYLMECIDSTYVSSIGTYVTKFEKMVAEYTGSKYAIATVNGTAALHTALLLSGVKENDEVITQSLTFVATANAISYTGANPISIDVDIDTMGLSPQSLKEWLEKSTIKRFNKKKNEWETINKKTDKKIAACIPMHTFGHSCRIDEIKIICDEYSIALIEDSAESLGTKYKGKNTGTFGLFGILSFNGNKTITTGGGGMILTNNKELAVKSKHITTTAKLPNKWEYIHDIIGFNYRLTNLSAALGVAQMEQLPDLIRRKRTLAKKYINFFAGSDIKFVKEKENTKANYWLNAILLKDRKKRDKFLKETNEAGIMTRPAWELMNKLPMYKDCQKGDLSNSEWLVDRLVNITSSVF